MELRQIVILVLQVSIVLTVFGFGLKATFDDLMYVVRRPGLLVRSLVAVLVIMPIVAVALVQAFDFPKMIEIVLIALAISPVPPLLPRKEAKAGGDGGFAIGLMAVLALVSIVTIPCTLAAIGWYYGRPFGMPASAVAGIAMKATLLPLVA